MKPIRKSHHSQRMSGPLPLLESGQRHGSERTDQMDTSASALQACDLPLPPAAPSPPPRASSCVTSGVVWVASGPLRAGLSRLRRGPATRRPCGSAGAGCAAGAGPASGSRPCSGSKCQAVSTTARNESWSSARRRRSRHVWSGSRSLCNITTSQSDSRHRLWPGRGPRMLAWRPWLTQH